MKIVMVELSVSLLGSFEAKFGERPLSSFRTKSVQALLIYLLCQADRAHQREALMALLWPGMPLISAQANMRQTLYRLKKLIPEVKGKGGQIVPFLIANRQAIQVNPDADYYLDVDAFSGNEPAEAIALYRGDFLADFYLADSAAFEEFVSARRADYRRRMLEMLDVETAAQIRQANYDKAIQLARRQLEIDNLRESGHRQLMEAWTRNGRRREALAHYDYLYQLLQDELAIEPEPTTKSLLEAIRAGELSQPAVLAAPRPIGLEKVSTARKHNLPAQTTLFIGREGELAYIAGQLADPACRLLTILGAGGMGKTRLGVEAAQAQVENFRDGVVYVSLAPISSDQLTPDSLNPLVSALIDALKVSFQGSDPPQEQLLNYLRRREMLLVFDNFEHLLETAGFLSDILVHAPTIKILTTSRERLDLQEEWLLALQGLSYSHEAGRRDELSAVQLFDQRARQVRADFDWIAEESAVLRICRLVEGMPLGLELAAAWVMQLSCQEIADEIEAGLDFLTTEMRNVPDRHRHIRTVFGYSWQKLTGKEKDVLRKLSVFRGGFDRRAAQAVAGASLPTLARLVSKSLLSVGENGRYAIHELLRQFAAEKLAQTETHETEAGNLHCDYFLTLLAIQEPKIRGPEFLDMLATIEMDLDNVRTAVQWAANHQPQHFNQAVGFSLWMFYDARTLYLEGERVFGLIAGKLKRGLDLDRSDTETGSVPPENILWSFYNAAYAGMKMLMGRLQEAEPVLHDSLLMLPANDPTTQWTRGFCLFLFSSTAYYNGDLPLAISCAKEAKTLFKAIRDTWYYGVASWFLGLLEFASGNTDEDQRLQEESERILRQLGDQKFIGPVLNELGRLALFRGDLDQAESYVQSGWEQNRRLGSIADITLSLNSLGEVAYLKGEYRKAQAYYEQCLSLVREVNMDIRVQQSLWNLGNLAVAEGDFRLAQEYFDQADFTTNVNQGFIGGPGWAALGLADFAEARRYFLASLKAMLRSGAKQVGLDALVGMAQLRRQENQSRHALELLALVKHHPANNWQIRVKVHKLWRELAAELPPELISDIEGQGRELDLSETAETLLDEEPI